MRKIQVNGLLYILTIAFNTTAILSFLYNDVTRRLTSIVRRFSEEIE